MAKGLGSRPSLPTYLGDLGQIADCSELHFPHLQNGLIKAPAQEGFRDGEMHTYIEDLRPGLARSGPVVILITITVDPIFMDFIPANLPAH